MYCFNALHSATMFQDFKKFATRGNLVDLAIGVVIGTAFASVTKSFVDDIVMPPLGLLTGNIDFGNMYILLSEGTPGAPYNTLADAQAAGAIALRYGAFITTILNFLIVAFAMFVVVRAYNRAEESFKQEQPDAPGPRKCPHCIAPIPDKATRCPSCTTELSLEEGW
jgi:large conductance mechanosensitive channel